MIDVQNLKVSESQSQAKPRRSALLVSLVTRRRDRGRGVTLDFVALE